MSDALTFTFSTDELQAIVDVMSTRPRALTTHQSQVLTFLAYRLRLAEHNTLRDIEEASYAATLFE